MPISLRRSLSQPLGQDEMAIRTLTGSSLPKNFLSISWASPTLSMMPNLQSRFPMHAVTLTTSSRSAPRGVPFFSRSPTSLFELARVHMRQLHGLPGREMEVFYPVTTRNLTEPLHLCRGDHPGRHAEADDNKVGIAFRDDPTPGIEFLIDLIFFEYHS